MFTKFPFFTLKKYLFHLNWLLVGFVDLRFFENRGTFCLPNFRLVILKEKSVCYPKTSCCSSLRDVQAGRPFATTFCGSSNLEQILPFWATFEQNIGLEHISSTKKSTISLIENFIFLNYFEERKIKLFLNVFIKILRDLGGNFSNLGSNVFGFLAIF